MDVRWDILIAASSAGLCAGCAYLLHQRNSHLNAVSQATAFSTVSRLIDYLDENEVNEIELISVTGKVAAIGGAIKSKYLDNLEGVISEQQVVEHRSEWSSALQRWLDSESLISLATNQVPFSLTDGVNFISVFSPNLSYQSPTQIVYDKFEPKDEASAVRHLVNYVVGSQVKGHQYLEKLLPVETILTAIGTVKRSEGELSIAPPENGLPYLISRQSLTEVLQDLKGGTLNPKICMVIFGAISFTAISYMAYSKYQKYLARKKREALIREMESMRDANGDSTESCVVCLDNPRGTVLIPCGHVCVCLLCSEQVDTCPVCRQEIEQIVRTYNA